MKIYSTEGVFNPEPVRVPVNNLNYGLFLNSLDSSINNRGVCVEGKTLVVLVVVVLVVPMLLIPNRFEVHMLSGMKAVHIAVHIAVLIAKSYCYILQYILLNNLNTCCSTYCYIL